jgi:Arc/MetJ-type ribon-helix-helix transcriptional regulator
MCVRRDMEKNRITIRLPAQNLHSIDLFIRAGEFSSRSEVIRKAVNDFIKEYTTRVIEKAENMRKMKELENAVRIIKPHIKI